MATENSVKLIGEKIKAVFEAAGI
ncbi:helix-turn-helix domain-containing protein, partial [Leptospira interrogans]